MASSGTLTYADLADLPDDGLRRELIAGELVVTASPVTRHQAVSIRLAAAFQNHVNDNGGATVFAAPLDVVLSDRDVVQPDLIVILDHQREIITDRNVAGVPALLIEIVSDTRLDRVRKRDLYQRFGVPEYWVVDPDADRVEVYRLINGRYAKPEIYERGEALAYSGLPGFLVDLTQLFARLARG